MGIIFIFFGKNVTGKSTLIENTSQKLGLNVAHTRRLLAATDPTKPEKDLLMGYERISQSAYLDAIKSDLIARRNQNGLIVEGPFSAEEVKKIQMFFPKDQVVLVQPTSSLRIRISRLAARNNLTLKQAYKKIHQSDRLRAKKGLASLERLTDITLTNNAGLQELYKQFHERALNHQRRNLLRTLSESIRKRTQIKR